MDGLTLEWYQNHTFVQAWRDQDCNSYFPVVESLNSTLNIDVNNPITVLRVDRIVGQYLKSLYYRIKKETSGKVKCRKELAVKFKLNQTEVNYIVNKLREQ